MTPARLLGVGHLHERPTLDVVVLVLVVVVGIVLVGAFVVAGVLEIMDPSNDTTEIVSLLDAQLGTIIGALLGLIAGQSAGRREPGTTLS